MLKIWAQPLQYYKGVTNKEIPLIEAHIRNEAVDKLLIENGQRIVSDQVTMQLRCDEAT
jgi:hypothetical protein